MTQLRTLVVGYGRMGIRHAETILEHPAFTLSGVVDPNPPVIKDDTVGVYPRLEDALARDYDCAVIATPHEYLADATIECLQAGLHTLTEKPGATTAEQARQVAHIAAAADRAAIVGYTELHNPAVHYLLRRAPTLGGITHIDTVRFNPEPAGPPDPALDLLTHDLAVIHALSRAINTPNWVLPAAAADGAYATFYAKLQPPLTPRKEKATTTIRAQARWLSPYSNPMRLLQARTQTGTRLQINYIGPSVWTRTKTDHDWLLGPAAFQGTSLHNQYTAFARHISSQPAAGATWTDAATILDLIECAKPHTTRVTT